MRRAINIDSCYIRLRERNRRKVLKPYAILRIPLEMRVHPQHRNCYKIHSTPKKARTMSNQTATPETPDTDVEEVELKDPEVITRMLMLIKMGRKISLAPVKEPQTRVEVEKEQLEALAEHFKEQAESVAKYRYPFLLKIE